MGVREKLVELCEDLETLPCCSTYEEQAEYLISHGVTVQEWISVEDRLPEKSGYYLVAVDIAYMSVVQYSAKHKAFNAWDGFDDARHSIDVTHWMPLPQPPKGE